MKKDGSLVDLKTRTKRYALDVIALYISLPKSGEAQVIGRQLLKSGTSVGAHYREAGRGRSDAEFISKMEVGLQELEESAYWLELLTDSGIVPANKARNLVQETEELTSIFVTCIKRVKQRT